MLFTGVNFKSVPSTHELNFELGDIYFFNTGEFYLGLTRKVDMGFSGDSQNLNFKIQNNRLYDPEGRAVYGFNSSSPLTLNVNVSTGNYEYYINGELICASGEKPDFEIKKLYINCNGTSLMGSPVVMQAPIEYDIIFNSGYHISGNLTGTFINKSNSDVILHSGVLIADSLNLDTSLIDDVIITKNSSGNFLLKDLESQDGASYRYALELSTNFGKIIKRFSAIATQQS